MNPRLSWLRLLTLLLPLVLVLPGCGGGATTTTTVTSTGGKALSSGYGTTLPYVCTPTNEQFMAYPGVSGANIAPIYTDNCATRGTIAASNIPYTSVYLCAPSGSPCAWIDHLQIDTGSVGLRVLASAIPANVLAGMPAVTGSGVNPQGAPVSGNMGECYQFVLSYFWGGLRQANIKMGGVPSAGGTYTGNSSGQAVVHVLNDSTVPAGAPTVCTSAAGSGSTPETTAAAIGANGVLGIGLHPNDSNSAAIYFACPDTVADNCGTMAQVTTAQVVPNPVSAMLLNGTSLTLDSAPTIRSHAVTYNSYQVTITLPNKTTTPLTNISAVAGYLTLGIPASGAGSPTAILLADPHTQRVSAVIAGKSFPSYSTLTQVIPSTASYSDGAFIDSGSNSYFFTQTDLPFSTLALNTCTDNSFACGSPAGTASTITKSLVLSSVGTDPTLTASAPFTVGSGLSFNDADYLFTTYYYSPVYEGLAAIEADPTPTTPPAPPAPPNPFLGQFDLGLPFFFGRTVYFGVYDGVNANTAYYGL